MNADNVCNPNAEALNKALEQYVKQRIRRKVARLKAVLQLAALATVFAPPPPALANTLDPEDEQPFGGRGCGDPDCDICV